ncbi:BQ2448_3977 [Microbotryum intermedium]|uniref:RNA methyltransferase n=1 Tax=Microbotryum intermedium TaxID=269621 RepID=A0A238FF51_9BASI|nr:BQ2448_3977 [Microbotryum intermedium]
MSSSRSVLNLRATSTTDGDSSSHASPQSSVPPSPRLPTVPKSINPTMAASTTKSRPLLSISTFFNRAKATRRQEPPPALRSLGQIVHPHPDVLTGECFMVANRPRSSSLSHTPAHPAYATPAPPLPSSPSVPQLWVSTPESCFSTALVEADPFRSSHEEWRSRCKSSDSNKFAPERHVKGGPSAVSAPVTPSFLGSASPSSIAFEPRDRQENYVRPVQSTRPSLDKNSSDSMLSRPQSTPNQARMPHAGRGGSHTSSNSSSSSSPVRSSTESATESTSSEASIASSSSTSDTKQLPNSPMVKRLKRRGVVLDVETGNEPLSSPELTTVSLGSTPRSTPNKPEFQRLISTMSGQDVVEVKDAVAPTSTTRARSSSAPAPSSFVVDVHATTKQHLAPPLPIRRPLLAQLQPRDVTSSFASTISTTSTEADLATAQVVQVQVGSAVRASTMVISAYSPIRAGPKKATAAQSPFVGPSLLSLQGCTTEDLITKINQLEEQKKALEAALEGMRVRPTRATTTTTNPTSEPAKELSNTARDRLSHRLTPFGNYHQYYSHRAQVTPDARLSLLPRSLFSDRRILDLGCNAGKLTLESLTHLGAKKAIGIDLDPILIEQARSAEVENRRQSPDKEGLNVEWRCQDFMASDYTFGKNEADTILLLSITKWLHLNHGDAALRNLFKALYEALPSGADGDGLGGVLVVEPQEKKNYQSAARKNKDLKPMFKTLEMWPPFIQELENVGFQLEDTIEREEGGFSRPLMVWRK